MQKKIVMFASTFLAIIVLLLSVTVVLGRTIFRVQVAELYCRMKSEDQARGFLTEKLALLRTNPSLDSIPEKTIPLYESMINKKEFYYQDFNIFYDRCIEEKKALALSKDELSDRQRVKDLESIRLSAMAYYNKYDELPDTIDKLSAFDPQLSYRDPDNHQPYIVRKISSTDQNYNTDIEVCIDYKTRSPKRYFIELKERGVMIWWDRQIHEKGNECNRIIVTNNPMREELGDPEFASLPSYGNGLVKDKWIFNGTVPPTNIEIGFTNQDPSRPRGMALRLPPQKEALFTSDIFKITPGERYILTIWAKSLSSCNNCAFAGVKFYDTNKNQTNYTDYNKCGIVKKGVLDVSINDSERTTTNPFLYYLVRAPGGNFTKNEFTCITHPEAKYAKVVFGYLREPKMEWIFDNVTFQNKNKPHWFQP